MPYNPNFNRSAIGKFNPDLAFISIKSGSDAYLLEDEVNEMQWMQINTQANLIRQATSTGCLQINNSTYSTKKGALVNFGNQFLNSFAVTPFYAILNGYLAYISAFSATTNITNNTVQLTGPSISGSREDFVFLEFWFQELDPTDSIPKFGGLRNDPLSYELVDTRIAAQTSNRVQLQWRIRNASNNGMGFVDGSGNVNTLLQPRGALLNTITGYPFIGSLTDSYLYVAGNGTSNDKTVLQTVDGFIYATPLFFVKRLNSSGYDSHFNLDGAINYINSSSVSDRPDGKFANIVYPDQITDLRNLASIGRFQYDNIYLKIADFTTYQNSVTAQFTSTNNNITNQVATLNATITQKINDVNTTIANDVIALNLNISQLNTVVNNNYNTLNDDIGILNTTTVNIQNNLNGQVQRLDGKIDNLNTTLTTLITNDYNYLLSLIHDSQLNYDNEISLLNTQAFITLPNLINNSAASLTTTINNFNINLQAQITALQNSVAAISASLVGINSNISGLTTTMVTVQYDIAVLQAQMATLGNVSPPSTDLSTYGIEMNRQTTLTSGGIEMPDTTITCVGSGVVIPSTYSPVTNYCAVLTFLSSSTNGNIGEFWVNKADNQFLVKNTGLQGITVDVTTFKDVSGRIYTGSSNFNNSTGRTISLTSYGFNGTTVSLSSNRYLIFICPLEDTYGENGEVYVTIGSDLESFTVYNSGIYSNDTTMPWKNENGNLFDWIIVDTVGLTHTYFTAVGLGGSTGTIVAQSDFGSSNNYRAIIGTPISTSANPISLGHVGDITVAKSSNSLIIYNTGLAQGTVQCLVFKSISS